MYVLYELDQLDRNMHKEMGMKILPVRCCNIGTDYLFVSRISVVGIDRRCLLKILIVVTRANKERRFSR